VRCAELPGGCAALPGGCAALPGGGANLVRVAIDDFRMPDNVEQACLCGPGV